ncbi:4-coumarate--CoA ligase 1 [Eumeta japonica]|uniref:Luciferin 4-monooxygenase n=1 Tax=Eumeta variegata TaxID=151549 RepID=A0A4C1TL25_EUMVA|nr:4-coumarate--CoA ligase 1 [Eumeta japonica]
MTDYFYRVIGCGRESRDTHTRQRYTDSHPVGTIILREEMSRLRIFGRNAVKLFSHKRILSEKFTRAAHSLWREGNVVVSPHKTVEIPDSTLAQHVWANLDRWPQRTALVCGITCRQYTYEQAYQMSRNFAANLRKKFRLRDDDTVALVLPNLPEYPLALLGASEAGCVVTTVNPMYTAHEVQHSFKISNPKLVVTTADNFNVVKKAMELNKTDAPIIMIKQSNESPPRGAASFEELAKDNSVDKSILKEVKRISGDVCILPYSSGTTGLPKAVELTHRNIVANCIQQTEGVRLYEDTTANSQDTVLVVLPMFHSFGLGMLTLHKMSVGVRLVTLPKFNPKTYLDSLLKYKVNILVMAPPTVLFLGTSSEVRADHFEHVHRSMSGAAPLPQADIQRLFEKANRELNFVQGYGLTETSPLATLMFLGSKNYESSGYAIPNVELKIINSELQALGPNETGELLIRGPNVMRGYKDNPESNREAFLDGRWLRTGDLATINEAGEVTITDRLKELIKVKGFQVAPAELEAVLKEHLDVLDAAVVGVKDDTFGEVPKAFVVARHDRKLDSKKILDFVAERVAPYKKINEIVYIDSIPKNPSGKILRRLLKEK